MSINGHGKWSSKKKWVKVKVNSGMSMNSMLGYIKLSDEKPSNANAGTLLKFSF